MDNKDPSSQREVDPPSKHEQPRTQDNSKEEKIRLFQPKQRNLKSPGYTSEYSHTKDKQTKRQDEQNKKGKQRQKNQ